MIEALAVPTALVALAERGGKTQPLSFVRAAKLKRPGSILAGIFFATLASDFPAGSVGMWLATLPTASTPKSVVALWFFAFGLWALKPDTHDSEGSTPAASLSSPPWRRCSSSRWATRRSWPRSRSWRFDALVAVVSGRTTGMLRVIAPAVGLGQALAHKVDMTWMRRIAALLFVLLGALSRAAR